MSKMFFTFKWGKSVFITEDQLKNTLLLYYTKDEVDNILKSYTTKEEVAGELVNYLTNTSFQDFKQQLSDNFNEYNTNLQNQISELNNILNQDIQEVGNELNDTNQHLTNVINQLKSSKFVYIEGESLNWNSQDTYKVGAIVEYNNLLYLSKQENQNQIPTNENYWVLFGQHNIQVDLTNYYTKSEVDNKLQNYLPTEYPEVDYILKINTNINQSSGTGFSYNEWLYFKYINSIQYILCSSTNNGYEGLYFFRYSNPASLATINDRVLQVGDYSNIKVDPSKGVWVKTVREGNLWSYVIDVTSQIFQTVKNYTYSIILNSNFDSWNYGWKQTLNPRLYQQIENGESKWYLFVSVSNWNGVDPYNDILASFTINLKLSRW